MEVIFYSTHCPKCRVLESKLKAANVEFTEVDDVDEMIRLGFKSAPLLKVDGEVMDFMAANKWVNGVKEANGCNQCAIK